MFTKNSPTKFHSAAADNLRRIRASHAAFQAEKERIQADASRHPQYIEEKLAESRDRAKAAIDEPLRQLREVADQAAAERGLWANKLLVLSHCRFSSDPMIDATIALRTMTEMNAMPIGLLKATADTAQSTGDLARLYHAMLAGERFSGKGFEVDLSSIEIPEQTGALQAIDETVAMSATADYLLDTMAVSPKMGAAKLELARRMQLDMSDTRQQAPNR